jgi:hypothetical protein
MILSTCLRPMASCMLITEREEPEETSRLAASSRYTRGMLLHDQVASNRQFAGVP